MKFVHGLLVVLLASKVDVALAFCVAIFWARQATTKHGIYFILKDNVEANVSISHSFWRQSECAAQIRSESLSQATCRGLGAKYHQGERKGKGVEGGEGMGGEGRRWEVCYIKEWSGGKVRMISSDMWCWKKVNENETLCHVRGMMIWTTVMTAGRQRNKIQQWHEPITSLTHSISITGISFFAEQLHERSRLQRDDKTHRKEDDADRPDDNQSLWVTFAKMHKSAVQPCHGRRRCSIMSFGRSRYDVPDCDGNNNCNQATNSIGCEKS